MSKLPTSLVNKAAEYSELKDEQKLDLLNKLYWDKNLSWKNIADLCDTYPNKVRRDAKRLGMESRTKSQAQSAALETGRHKHPTKGIGHSDIARENISESVAKKWEELSEQERAKRRLDAKKRWDMKSDEEIKEFRKASIDAIRETATKGSALEIYLMEGLIKAGYRVEFHREHWVERERLQIDLLIPALSLAIEVDGPSHYEDIWGADVLKKNQARDHEKNGLLLRQGYVIIRIRQGRGSLSEKFKRDTLRDLIAQVKKIEKKKPKMGERHIILGEVNE